MSPAELMEPVFLALDEVLELHAQQIERYGGSAGLRDAAALESAVATAQATFGGKFLHSSIPAMAAAYLFHLCQNHPFVDGNKRVAFAVVDVFLRINGYTISAESTSIYDHIVGLLESRSFNMEHLVPWLHEIVHERP